MASNNGASENKNTSYKPQRVNVKNTSMKSWPDFHTSSPQSKKLRTRQYTYIDLKDILPDTVVDVYGVVKFFKLPQKTRGTDYGQVISIIDPTLCGSNKLTCLLFAREESLLPPVKIGSIIRLHRLRVGLHNGAMQGMKASGFSWLVADGNSCDPIVQKASTTNYTFTDVDKEKIQHLQKWYQEQEELKDCENSLCLEKIVPSGYFNLVCQVVSVCLIQEDVCLLLQVCDGTCPNYPIRNIETAGAKDFAMNKNQELLEKFADYIYDVCIFDDHVKKAGNIQPGTFVKLYNLHAAKYKTENCEGMSGTEILELVLHQGSSYGRGMKVLPDSDPEVCSLRKKLQQVSHRLEKCPRRGLSPSRQQQQTTKPEEPQPGCSTDIQHVQTEENSDKTDVFIQPSKIPYRKLKRKNVHTSSQTQQSSSSSSSTSSRSCWIISTISNQNAEFSSIVDIIRCKQPSKYRLLTRVLKYFPKIDTSPSFIKLYCPECHCIIASDNEKYKDFFLPNNFVQGPKCPDCHQINKTVVPYLQYIFKLKLLLTDCLGYMFANLWKEDAVKFFDGLTPQKVIKDKEAYNHLLDLLELMCPKSKQPLSRRPVMECCIKSYTNCNSSLISYQLFDTILCNCGKEYP